MDLSLPGIVGTQMPERTGKYETRINVVWMWQDGLARELRCTPVVTDLKTGVRCVHVEFFLEDIHRAQPSRPFDPLKCLLATAG